MVNSDHVSVRFERNTNFNPIYLRNAMVDLLTRPPGQESQMSTDVAIPTEAEIVPVAPKKFKPVETDIDHLKDRMDRLVTARRDLATLKAFVEMEERFIKDELAKLGATDGRINGVVAVTYRPKNDYRFAEFREDYPEIYARYLEPTIVDQLNRDKLLQDHAGLLAKYRSSAFSVK